jgi:hypothetical protein
MGLDGRHQDGHGLAVALLVAQGLGQVQGSGQGRWVSREVDAQHLLGGLRLVQFQGQTTYIQRMQRVAAGNLESLAIGVERRPVAGAE